MSRPPWPFMSRDERTQSYAERDALWRDGERRYDEPPDEDETDSPYCECDNEPTMNEEFSRKCATCGKALIS